MSICPIYLVCAVTLTLATLEQAPVRQDDPVHAEPDRTRFQSTMWRGNSANRARIDGYVIRIHSANQRLKG
jgi:hypothetical protein